MEGYIAMSFFCHFVRLTNRAILQNNLVVSDCYYLNIEKYIEPILFTSDLIDTESVLKQVTK